jgi:hypothetical protein
VERRWFDDHDAIVHRAPPVVGLRGATRRRRAGQTVLLLPSVAA